MEGTAVRVAADRLADLTGKEVLDCYGAARIGMRRLQSKKLEDVFSRGKQLLLRFDDFHVRIHFMMYGSFTIDALKPNRSLSLALEFEGRKICFYACSVRIIEDELGPGYDEDIDITSEAWDLGKVLSLAAEKGDEMVCDVLMDQEIFAGVGNMIKNEALSRSRVHPGSLVGKIPVETLRDIVGSTRDFSMQLYEAERAGRDFGPLLKIYRRRTCPSCGCQVTRRKTGNGGRVSFYCPSCQVLYS
jgi:endonuclease-8